MILLPRQRFSGRYKFSAFKSDGRVRPLTDWFDNMILDQGLDLIPSSSAYLDACHVGTDATAPAVGQTALIAPLAGTADRIAASSSAANVEPYQGRSNITYRFPVGSVTGVLKEVGIGASSTPGSALFSRALTPNVYGDAAEIEVFDDEYLDVQYELTNDVPAELVGSFVIGNTTHAYIVRPAFATQAQHWAPYRASGVASSGQAARALFPTGSAAHAIVYSGAMGTQENSPAGTAVNCTSVVNTNYVAGSFQRLAAIRWSDSVANFGAGGVRSALIRFTSSPTGDGGNSIGAFQMEFTPAIPKTANEALYLNVVWNWGRA